MTRFALFFLTATLSLPTLARAQFDTDSLRKAAGQAGKAAAGQAEERGRGAAKKVANDKLEKSLNQKLLDESRKNQCAFKSGSDEFEGNCDDKVNNLFNIAPPATPQTVSQALYAGSPYYDRIGRYYILGVRIRM